MTPTVLADAGSEAARVPTHAARIKTIDRTIPTGRILPSPPVIRAASRCNLGKITPASSRGSARGVGGHESRNVSVIPKLFADFTAQGESEIWNIQMSDKVTAPVIRQTIKRGHGNM
jgi:hypothetical protein